MLLSKYQYRAISDSVVSHSSLSVSQSRRPLPRSVVPAVRSLSPCDIVATRCPQYLHCEFTVLCLQWLGLRVGHHVNERPYLRPPALIRCVFNTAFCLYVCIFFLCATVLVNKDVYNQTKSQSCAGAAHTECYDLVGLSRS